MAVTEEIDMMIHLSFLRLTPAVPRFERGTMNAVRWITGAVEFSRSLPDAPLRLTLRARLDRSRRRRLKCAGGRTVGRRPSPSVPGEQRRRLSRNLPSAPRGHLQLHLAARQGEGPGRRYSSGNVAGRCRFSQAMAPHGRVSQLALPGRPKSLLRPLPGKKALYR